MSVRISGVLLVIGMLLASACAAPAEAPKKLTKLTIGYTAEAGGHVPVWLAKDAGLFEKYGLDVEVIYIAGSTKGASAVVSGDLQFADGSAEAAMHANLAGGDLVTISSGFAKLIGFVYSPQDLNSVRDLKGKDVAMTRAGTVPDFALRWVLQKYGLEGRKDVGFLEAGGTAENLAALQAGVVKGAYLSPPLTVKARKLGFKQLVDIAAEGLDYSMFSMLVRKKYLSANKDIVRNYLKAYAEGIALAKKDKARAKQAIGKYLKTTDDEELEESYNVQVAKGLQEVPYTNPAGVKIILAELVKINPKAVELKAEDIYDNSYVKELEDSGFIRKLYQ